MNYYGGECLGGPRGVVRAYVDGRIFEQPFHILASSGNFGAESRDYWVRIDPVELFNRVRSVSPLWRARMVASYAAAAA